MKLNVKKIGRGNPKVTIVGCLHGDEIIGKKAVGELKKFKLVKGSLRLIIANEPALRKKKRMIKKDLNRSFPGRKNGRCEDRLAYYIRKDIQDSDLVIDVHATNAKFKKLAIVMDLNKSTKKLLKIVPIQKIALIKKEVFGGGEMIREVKNGIAIEYGPDKSGRNYKAAVKDILIILSNLGLVEGMKTEYNKKDLYIAHSSYKVPANFKKNQKLKEFKIIRKGDLIGEIGRKLVYSDKSFYPLFLGEGKYKEILAIAADRKKIVL